MNVCSLPTGPPSAAARSADRATPLRRLFRDTALPLTQASPSAAALPAANPAGPLQHGRARNTAEASSRTQHVRFAANLGRFHGPRQRPQLRRGRRDGSPAPSARGGAEGGAAPPARLPPGRKRPPAPQPRARPARETPADGKVNGFLHERCITRHSVDSR